MRHDGGDFDRDDYGLPRVDVVVPDDARELEADLLAYRREQRRRRRIAAWKRWLFPATGHGIAVPLIAAALLVALVSGILMTVLGPRSSPQVSRGRIADSPSAGPGEVGGPLSPKAVLYVNGRAAWLSDFRPGVIALVPGGCRCDALLLDLAAQTRAARLKLTLTTDRRGTGGAPGFPAAEAPTAPSAGPDSPGVPGGTGESSGTGLTGGRAGSTTPPPASAGGPSAEQTLKELLRIKAQAEPGAIEVADDREGTLAASYRPIGLTAVLVRPDGIVTEVQRDLRPGADLRDRLAQLLN